MIVAQTVDELMEEFRPQNETEYFHSGEEQTMSEGTSATQNTASGYNWVLHSNDRPSTAMDAVIHPLADAVRVVVQAQDDLSCEMTRHEKTLGDIKEQQQQILENVASLKASFSASMKRSETKEDPTTKVLKASIKLLQDQHSEMKKQLMELKNREEGEVADSHDKLAKDTPKALTERARLTSFSKSQSPSSHDHEHETSHRSYMHTRIRNRDYVRDSSASDKMDVLSASDGMERDLVHRELSSLTRRVVVLFQDVDTVNRDFKKLNEAFQNGKDSMQIQQKEMHNRITALEKAFVHEANEQRLSLTRTRTLTMMPVDSMKHHMTEMWKCLLELEQRLTGGSTAIDKRQARCLSNEGHVLYWRDKLVNASNCHSPEDKFNAFRSVAGTILSMQNFNNSTRGMVKEHMPNERGLQFLTRCVGWWEASYNDAKALRSMFGLLGGIKRGPSPNKEEVIERDSKRLLLTSKMQDVSLRSPIGAGKELLGSLRRQGASLSSSSRGIPTGPNADRIRNGPRSTDGEPFRTRDLEELTRTEDAPRRPSMRAYHSNDREKSARRERDYEYRASPSRSFYS